MKRIMPFLALTLLLGCLLGAGNTARAADEVTYSAIQDIYNTTGLLASGNAVHGGNQTRICRTENGTYIAFISAEEADGNKNSAKLNQFSVVRVMDENTSVVVYQDYHPVDSSSVNIFCDDYGVVYVTSLTSNKLEAVGSGAETAFLKIVRIDPVTNEAQSYTMIGQFDGSDGYGYSMPCPDFANNKIYAIFCGGDMPGYFAWFTFDLRTMTWEKDVKTIVTDARHCYIYCYADGNGGALIVGQRDVKSSSIGKQTFSDADYVWDNQDLFIIPDMTQESYRTEPLYIGDYADPAWYPNSSASVFLDQSGYLHVLNRVRMYPSAQHHGDSGDVYMQHIIWDGRSVIYNEKISFRYEMQGGRSTGYDASMVSYYNVRMAQSNDGTLYILAQPLSGFVGSTFGELEVWRAKDQLGTDWELVSAKALTSVTARFEMGGLVAADNRSNSVSDNKIDVLYYEPAHSKNTFYTFCITLPDAKPAITTRRLQDGYVQTYYSQSVDVSYAGARPLSYGASGLPGGLRIDPDTGLISGIPEYIYTAQAVYYIEVSVSDGSETATRDYTLTVRNPAYASPDDEQAEEETDVPAVPAPPAIPTSPGTPVTPEAVLPFTDVLAGDWFCDAVSYVYKNGIMNGVAQTAFGPNEYTDRGMLITMLYRMEGSPVGAANADFRDVRPGDYFADGVAFGVRERIIQGYGDGMFGASDVITREQLATILYRYAQYKQYNLEAHEALRGYADRTAISDYAQTAMNWAVYNGLITGRSDGLAPGESATRAEVATILMRFLKWSGR